MSSVPVWIQVLQALLTPAIAIAVGVIGFLQWRTAHQKVMLDLFDRRWIIYVDLNAIIAEIITSPGSDHDRILKLETRVSEARFLFGEDFSAFADQLLEFARRLNLAYARLAQPSDVREIRWKEKERYLDALSRLYDEFPEVISPYMRMDQKRVRTPIEWLRDRNRARKHWAGEKQE